MSEVKELICITCPKGCQARVWEENGSIKVKGNGCKRGKAYLEQEFKEPMRVLTSTVVVESSPLNRLPVRTAGPIPKETLFRAMDRISRITVHPPVCIGDVILPDLLDTGVDLIAADDLLQ